MVNPYIFREYDIRGVAEQDFPDETVCTLGKALGSYFLRQGARTIGLGRDCRLSSPRLHGHLTQGILSTGCNIIDIGVVPTPLLYFSLYHLNIDGGVMITGSHNPPDHNGFKVCLGKNTLYGDDIQCIKTLYEKGEFEQGRANVTSEIVKELYWSTVRSLLSIGSHQPKIVIDSGNGTAAELAGPLYRLLGAQVTELFSEMDGKFPNHHPDPTIPENLRTLIERVRAGNADAGIAFDGDADRIGVVDDRGKIVWGDQLMVLFSRSILREIPGATVIAEVKCSQTLFDDIEKHGGKAIMGRVGHSLMKAKLKEEQAQLAGEMSGHIFFAHRYYGYDDAIYAGARLLEILSHTDEKLSELLSDIPPTVTTPEIRTECSDEIKFAVVQKLKERFKKQYRVVDVDGARVMFDGGWGLVRASNTQPVLVSRFEARDEKSLATMRKTVEEAVTSVIREIETAG